MTSLTPPADSDSEPANHGCRFAWCANGGDTVGMELEHFSDVHQIPATAEVTYAMVRDGEDIPTVDLSIWYQEDLEAGPDIHLSIGGQAADLKIDEAVLLADSLRRLIDLAVAGTKIDPAAIVKRRVDL